MLSLFAERLSHVWGPFRLLSSHLVLMSAGTLLAGFLTWRALPAFWRLLPQDRGKGLAGDGGKAARGKPTGAGLIFALALLPVILLFVPLLGVWELGAALCLYGAMLFGFLDDRSRKPWGELRKGLLDLAVSAGAAYCLYRAHGSEIWLPLCKGSFTVPGFWYVAGASGLLWFSTNATNCSDGVDGLAGSLTLGALLSLVVLLYLVVGYYPVSRYLLIPGNPNGARWAVLAATVAGALAGYLWYNAEPSRVMMGDAGSRLLGMLIGMLVLVAGNPFLIFVAAPVLMVNGGTGLAKLVILRVFRWLGFDVRPPGLLTAEQARRQRGFIRALHSVRFPLHDHFRRKKGWSNAMVLMRFMLIQAFLTPILFVIIVKIR